MTWLTLDEHPDSINDAFFITNPEVNHWQDRPASYHNGAAGFSFSDGHAEVHKWLSDASMYPVRFNYGSAKQFDDAGRRDMAGTLPGFNSSPIGRLLPVTGTV